MRVLHVISDRNIGGAGVLLLNLLRHFDRSEVESTVAMPRGSRLRERVLRLGIPVRELDAPCERFSLSALRELMHVIGETKPDIVHTNAAVCGRVAGRLCGKTVIYTRHCCFPTETEDPLPLRAAKRAVNRFFCDCAIATAEAAAEDLRQSGIRERDITVILNGCEPVREVGEAEKTLWRSRFGLAPSDFCVGICARLEPCKGHEIFLRAAQMVAEVMPEVPFRFLLIGEGSRRAELEQKAREWGIEDRVIFTGFQTDVAPLYRILNVHVNCSVGTETSCLAVSEGMSAGLPTVLSDFGGNRAMLEHSGAGYCIPAGNAPALAEALCRLAAQPALAEKMGRNARRRYEQKYTAVGMANRLTAVYRDLCGQK